MRALLPPLLTVAALAAGLSRLLPHLPHHLALIRSALGG